MFSLQCHLKCSIHAIVQGIGFAYKISILPLFLVHFSRSSGDSTKTSCSTMSTSSLRPSSNNTDTEILLQTHVSQCTNVQTGGRISSRSLLRSPLRPRSAEEGRRSRSLSRASFSSSAGPSPVLFSTTPPSGTHVKRPRRSVSPPRARPPRPSAPAPSSRRSSRAFCDMDAVQNQQPDDGLPPLPPTASAGTPSGT